MKKCLGVLVVLVLVFSLGAIGLPVPVLAQPEGLIAYYPFNGNANDESVNSHDGIVSGATLATDRFGNPSSAYSFNGSSNYVEVPDHADFDFGTGGFTVSAWIKTTAPTTVGAGRDDILAKGDPTISGFAISIRNNRAAFWVGSSGELFGSSDLNDGEWHHIVGTRDNSNNIALYVDGITEGTGINSESVDTVYNAFIGKHGTISESYFDGFIDDVSIYDRAVPPRGVFLLPSSQIGYDIPGATMSYTLEVINRTGSDDSFDLSVSDNAWPASLSTGNTGTIADGASVTFTVSVEIPTLASSGDTDTATITVTSVSDPTLTDSATVTTIMNRIAVSQDGKVEVTIISVEAGADSELGLHSPDSIVLFPSTHQGVGQSTMIGPYTASTELIFYITTWGSTVNSGDDPEFFRVTQIGSNAWILECEDAASTDRDYNDFIFSVNLVTEATVDFDPDTLNLKSKGKWVTCYIELPEDYAVEDVDVSTVELSYGGGGVSAAWGDVQDGVLMVKFDRSDVQDMLDPGDEVEITVSGELLDDTPFEDTDTIRVIDKGKK